MPCRVGITTDPSGRKSTWESKVVGLNNWRVYGPFSREEAQSQENMIARTYGCKAHPGGRSDPSRNWYVYTFSYLRTK